MALVSSEQNKFRNKKIPRAINFQLKVLNVAEFLLHFNSYANKTVFENNAKFLAK